MRKKDGDTSIDDLKRMVRVFCEERQWDPYHSPKDVAIGLVTEASELLEIFRFVNERDLPKVMEKPDQRQRMADELADSLYFILRFAQLYNFDLTTCMQEKMLKNAVKYPVTKQLTNGPAKPANS